MKYYDISPLLSPYTAVFPGDEKFSLNIAMDFKKGDHLLLSSMQSTLHVGAHVDAPNHYSPDGIDIASCDVQRYLGRAQVIEVRKALGSRIEWADIQDRSIEAPRILFKTLSYPNPEQWNGDFVALSAGLVKELSHRGVFLVGIDTPSVDPSGDKILETHTEIAKQKMSILEGIDLSLVPEGSYTLMALPLRIKDADASPVRALLIDEDLGIV